MSKRTMGLKFNKLTITTVDQSNNKGPIRLSGDSTYT